MKCAALLALLAGCVELADDGGDWTAIGTLEGRMAAERGPSPAPHVASSDPLRLVTFNVHYGTDVENLAAQITSSTEISRADAILVQEIESHPSEPSTRASRLATALGMTWVYVPAREEQAGTHGLAILSRWPIENAVKRELPYFDEHFNSRNRVAMGADLVVGDRRVHVVNVHLDVRIGASDRVRQLHPAVNELPTDALVLGGDFNTNPWAWVEGTIPLTGTEAIVGQEQAAVIDDYLGDNGFASAISVDESTMRLPAFQIRTDDLYARGYEIVGAGVEHVEGSDHWPVWVDIAR